jgi:hypothetical protein
MKKFAPLLVLFTFALAACGPAPILEDTNHRYFVSGNFAEWGAATEALDTDGETLTYLMEAVSVDDARVASVRSQLSNPTMLYVKEVVLPATAAGWGETFAITEDGEAQFFDGNLTIKILQTDLEIPAPIYWAQNRESGKVNNLTPGTLYLPPYSETPTYTDSGDWGSNPVALAAGTYTAVFGQQTFGGEVQLFLGLVAVTA